MTSTLMSNIVSFIALVLVPTGFWFGVAELVAMGFQYSYGGVERLTLVIGIFVLTLWVWTLLRITGDE